MASEILKDEPSSISTASYSEWPIDPESEIRIIELLPPASPDPTALQCNLITAKLSDKPAYEALSYAWCQPIFSDRLHLPTGYLAITSTLAAALRQLRHADRPRRIWADAVSINQQDDVEKGHQVQLMARVYRSTTGAVAWLGEGTPQTHEAIRIIKDLASQAWQFGILAPMEFWAYPLPPIGEGVKSALIALAGQLEWGSRAIRAFHSQSWFKRLWIVQEATLPRLITLHNGSDHLDFEDLAFASSIFALMLTLPDIQAENILNNNVIDTMSLVEERFRFQSSVLKQEKQVFSSIRSIIYNHRERQCCNDIDRIYGLLGLQHEAEPVKMDIKYGGSVEEVFQNFTIQHLKLSDISILNHAGSGWTEEQVDHKGKINNGTKSGLPTWAADWRLAKRTCIDPFSELFCAATDLPTTVLTAPNNLPFIGISGVKTSSVETESLFPSPNLMDVFEEQSHNLVETQRRLSERWELYPTGENIELAFSATMVMSNRYVPQLNVFGGSTDPQIIHSFWKEFKEATFSNGVNGKTPSAARSNSFADLAFRTCQYRNFLVTENGHFGLGPLYTKPGDIIVVFDGGRIPFVLRPIEPGNDSDHQPSAEPSGDRFSPEEQYELVGECYIHGLMDNEVVAPEWRAKSQTFWIK